MRKFLKGIAIALALALVVTPCAVLFAGCGAEEYLLEENLAYVTGSNLSHDWRASNSDWELVEEVKEGDIVVGKIYKLINSEERSEIHKLVILDEDTAEYQVNAHFQDDSSSADYFLRVTCSYEKYNGVYLVAIDFDEENRAYFIAEVENGNISLCSLDVETVEEAKEEIDAYIESEEEFLIYFEYNYVDML